MAETKFYIPTKRNEDVCCFQETITEVVDIPSVKVRIQSILDDTSEIKQYAYNAISELERELPPGIKSGCGFIQIYLKEQENVEEKIIHACHTFQIYGPYIELIKQIDVLKIKKKFKLIIDRMDGLLQEFKDSMKTDAAEIETAGNFKKPDNRNPTIIDHYILTMFSNMTDELLKMLAEINNEI